MSAEATGYVWKRSPYTGAQLLVHLALGDIANDIHDNEVWMSTANLAHKARVARSTVIEVLAHMVEHGYLDLIESGKAERKPSRYRFRFNMTAQRSSTRPLDPSEHDRSAVTNPIEITQEPKAEFSTGKADCVRCRGRGTFYNATGGFDVACSCVGEESQTV